MKFLLSLSCVFSIAVCSNLSSPKVLRTFSSTKGTTVEIDEPSFFSQVGLQRSWDSLWGTEFIRYERTFFQVDDYVTVVVPTALPDSFASSFILAAQVWNEVLGASKVNPIVFNSAFSVNANLGGCQLQQDFVFPAGSSITGLVIIAEVFAIDGPGNVLGFAGPCTVSSGFPRIGRMRFDSSDVENMLASGTFPDVIKHEMGHVIGIGTLWGNKVVDKCTTFNPCNGNPKFVGTNAIQGFNSLGGTGDLLVADAGGSGSANSHWRETTFRTELMSPSIAGPGNPLSIITIMSLIDIGYNVNVGRAENYQIPGVALPPGTTFQPTPLPTPNPTNFPTPLPTPNPTNFPTPTPTRFPTNLPTTFPTPLPTPLPTPGPTPIPSFQPTGFPANNPTTFPTTSPTIFDLGDDADHTPPEDFDSVLDRFRRRGEQFMIGVLSACGLLILAVVTLITLRIKRRGRAVGRVSSRIPRVGPQDKQVAHYLHDEKDAKMSAIAREL